MVALGATATAIGVVLIVLSFTASGPHRYWLWLALLALGGRAAIAVYALMNRRRG